MAKNKKKSLVCINITLLILYTISSIFIIYNILRLNGIENFIRYLIAIILGGLNFLILLLSIRGLFRKKKNILWMMLTIIIMIIQTVGGYYINKTYSTIDNLNKDKITYSASIISLADNSISSTKDINKKTIGIINSEDHYEGYVIGNELINENKLKDNNTINEYEDFISMLTDLYTKKIDLAIVSSSYISTFSTIDGFENISEETKIIITKEKQVDKKQSNATTKGTTKSITEPFTVLLLGIDSTSNNISKSSSFNGDSIMLVTFNPTTLNATILSIPRDTYVPIACFAGNKENKITHAAWYGESCMIKTIQNFTGINIDYYVKVNFKAVVNIVDAVDGITVDVPYSFCEQNSNRKWGSKTIYVKEGKQTLNGEQALALSRNRKSNSNKCATEWTYGTRNDFVRGQNQQIVLNGLLNKFKSIRNINQLYDVLEIIEKNMDTNLTTDQILSFYNIGKNILKVSNNNNSLISMQKLYLSGYDAMIYDAGSGLTLYNFVYYNGSLADIVKAMKINLGLTKPTLIKDFSYSIKEPYTQTVIGKGYYNEAKIVTIPNFTKYGKSYALSWGNSHNVNINFNTINSTESIYIDGQIIKQSVTAGTKLTSLIKASGITLNIINKSVTTTKAISIDCSLSENIDNSDCLIPNMANWSTYQMNTWVNKVKKYSTIQINTKKISYSEAIVINPSISKNSVVSQSVPSGTKLKDINDITIIYVDEDVSTTTTTTTTTNTNN